MTEVTQGVITGENTISKMVKAKIIQARQTGLFIQVKNIHNKLRANGSNWNSRDMTSEKTREAISAIVAHIQAGGPLPAIVVQPRADGGVQKVDGYQRHEAYKIVDASGEEGELWVPIVPFLGTELEALAFISTSGNNNKINPLEQLDNYKRIRQQLIDEGNAKPSLQDIADLVLVSRQYVDTIMKLDALDDAGKAMVSDGKVSVAVAVKAVRASPEDATALLEEAAKNAAAQGKKKVTTTTSKAVTIGTPLLLDLHQIGLNMRENIGKEVAAKAEQFLRGDLKGDVEVTMPIRDIAMMLAVLRQGDDNIEKAKAAAMAKADKAKQLPIDEAPAKLEEEPSIGPGTLGHVDEDPLADLGPNPEDFNIPDDAPEIEIPDVDAPDDDNAFAFLG